MSLAALALTACGSSRHPSRATRTPAATITTEPVFTAGVYRFTVPAGVDLQGLERLYGNLTSASGSPVSYRGDRAGLYADIRGRSSCDASTLEHSLEQNPREAAAWASTLGIAAARIPAYMSSLTPVVLRVDTRVTNHGWTNGSVTRFQAVLQAGTSVLVDRYGLPVIKCYCGNPLSAPQMSSSAGYTGPQWSGFSVRRLASIARSDRAIRVFTLYDPSSNGTFQRAAGTNIAANSSSAAGAGSVAGTSGTAAAPSSTGGSAEQTSTASTDTEPTASTTASGSSTP